jgi:serine/threonine-protein kinase
MDRPLSERLQEKLGAGYQVQDELGGGGMSRVFAALDVSLGRRVVVKVLSPELASGVNGERFRREILLAAQLQHPHIVPVLAAGEVDGLPFFIMPFVQGQSLRQRLDGVHPLPIQETISILRDVARALSYAHSAGVIHRDIKPENVLLSSGSAAVTDFGIAKALSTSRVASGATLTQGGTSLGTPAYMAPEQAAADPSADHRADLYSFGILAYELASGRPPFHGRSPQALLTAHMAESPEPLQVRAPNVPPALATLVMRCLEKNPADRPPTATAVLDALDRLDISGSHATVPMMRLERPRRIRWAIVAVIGSRALIGSYYGWRKIRSPAPSLDASLVAVAPFRVASADPSLHYLREGMLDLLAAKLTGEGGLRATEPRQALTAWQESGGSGNEDLDQNSSLGMARRLSAGRLLLGDVVGTPNHLVLSAALLEVPGGAQVTRVSAEGPPDSLSNLVNEVAVKLLSAVAGEGSERLPKLTSTSLPALRAYLDGKAKYRRGEAQQAVRDFNRALDYDSTFALAALAMRMASAWYGDNVAAERGLRLANRGKNLLSQRDRALLEAVGGVRYPAVSSTVEEFQAKQRYLNIAPDRADAWELFGDEIFHFGTILGYQTPSKDALTAFKRSLDLDSTNAVAFSHILFLAVMEGDTALERRVVRLSALMPDSTSRGWLEPYHWYKAHATGDSATWLGYRDSVRLDRQNMLYRFLDHAIYNGTGTEDAWYALQSLILKAPTRTDRRNFYGLAHGLAMLRGRPHDALSYLQQQTDDPDDINLNVTVVRDAMMANGDTVAARRAAAILRKYEDQAPSDSLKREQQHQAVRTLEPWRLSRGDTSHTRVSLDRLRAYQRATGGATTETEIEIALIQAMQDQLLRRPQMRRSVERLDSLLTAVDYRGAHVGRFALYNTVAALIFETLGDTERAYAAARRRAMWWNQYQPYLATQLREEGRLAALAGHRERAIDSYRHYLALRTNPEPEIAREVEQIREELQRLEQTDTRR